MSHFLRPLLERQQEAKLVVERTGALFAAVLETAFDSATRRRGLLGREDLPAGQALVLAPCNAVHTFRMRFPIDVVFVARDGRITKIVERLAAWRAAASFSAFATIELRAGAVDGRDVIVGDRLALRITNDDLRSRRDIRLVPGRQGCSQQSSPGMNASQVLTKFAPI